jgi:hypothetical protein
MNKNKKRLLNVLKKKKLLFAPWGGEDKFYTCYQYWYHPLQKFFGNIVSFDPKKNLSVYGKEKMNERFLEVVKKEKPDYVFFWLIGDEFDPDTFAKLRKLSPKTIIFNFFGDDDAKFENFSRYWALFFDYCLYLPQPVPGNNSYKKDGINSSFPSCGINTENFKPLSLEKKYDVTFIGTPKKDRKEFIQFLIDNGVDINLFGWGWEKYPSLKKFYKGPLSSEELVKISCQSKINLCFTKNYQGEPHLKGRVFEIGGCKSFVLVEDSPRFLNFFKKEKEIVMFKDKEDLLEKIKYYLKHEKEREKIAENAYKRILREYNLDTELSNFFSMTEKRKNRRKLPEIKGKTMLLTKKDFELSEEELKKKIKDYDYIHFNDGNAIFSPYKEYLQAYSLEKTGNQISCCDFYVNSDKLGNYMSFEYIYVYKEIPIEEFNSFFNINQIMVIHSFFVRNIKKFRKILLYNEKINFIIPRNTEFVDIPLVIIKADKFDFNVDYLKFKKFFNLKIFDSLSPLIYQKKLFSTAYFYNLLFRNFPGKKLVLRYLYEEKLKNRNYFKKFKDISLGNVDFYSSSP